MAKGVLLAIVAHPDDETLGCGGTLALHAEMGNTVKVLCLTIPSEERREEFREACLTLGVEELKILEEENLKDEPQTVTGISDAIVSNQPAVVITHLGYDYHREHRLASKLVKEAIEWAAHTTTYNEPWVVGSFLQMEVNTLVPNPHVILDITEAFQRKMEALECYQSQLAKFPDGYYRRFTQVKAQLRGTQGGIPYAEAFEEEPLAKNSPFYKHRSTKTLLKSPE